MNRRELLRRIGMLAGGVLSASVARGIAASESAARKAAVPLFDKGQRRQVDIIAELIIPTTDTPGAFDAGVPDFIEMMVAEWYTEVERRIFLDGLRGLDQWCQATHGSLFVDSSEAQQIDALLAAEREASGYQAQEAGFAAMMGKGIDENTPFFTKLKELTVIGYYTSEVGATLELVYQPMPMRYEGDIPYADVARQWSS